MIVPIAWIVYACGTALAAAIQSYYGDAGAWTRWAWIQYQTFCFSLVMVVLAAIISATAGAKPKETEPPPAPMVPYVTAEECCLRCHFARMRPTKVDHTMSLVCFAGMNVDQQVVQVGTAGNHAVPAQQHVGVAAPTFGRRVPENYRCSLFVPRRPRA